MHTVLSLGIGHIAVCKSDEKYEEVLIYYHFGSCKVAPGREINRDRRLEFAKNRKLIYPRLLRLIIGK